MMTQRLLRLPQVEEMTGYKRASIYRLITAEDFPAPIKIGDRASAWIETEVDEWISRKIAESRTSS